MDYLKALPSLYLSFMLWFFIKLPLALIGSVIGIPLVILSYYTGAFPDVHPDVRKLDEDDTWRYRRLLPWFDYIWGNPKYGADGNWFWRKDCLESRPEWVKTLNDSKIQWVSDLSKWFWHDNKSVVGRYKWLFVRNPVSGLGYTKLFSVIYWPRDIEQIGPDVDDNTGVEGLQITRITASMKSGLYWVKHNKAGTGWWVCRLGYKLNKGDSYLKQRAKLSFKIGFHSTGKAPKLDYKPMPTPAIIAYWLGLLAAVWCIVSLIT